MKEMISSVRTWLTRHRSLFLFGGAALTAWLSYRSDPDHGLSTLLGGLAIAQGIWAIAATHWARKALMDYKSKAADMEALFLKAQESSTGAGLALIAIAIMFFSLVFVFAPRAHAAELVPPGAKVYCPMLQAEQRRLWPDHPDPAALCALVEQESCVSLASPRCWNPKAKLKTAREEGAGMGQITRAFRADGSLRFDALADLRARYRSELGEWSWDNAYTRPDLQLRGIVLLSRDAARPFRQAPAMLAFGDAAYNGGPGDTVKERRACALTRDCDPRQWFGHVEAHCLKSRQPLYGGRSACNINREHVRNVLQVRRARYVPFVQAA
jgi:hypothetical protein